MHRDDYQDSGTSLLSFLAGTVIGAGIALLYAPKTGKETREILVDYGQDLKEMSANFPGSACDSTDSLVDRGRNLVDRGKDLIEQGTDMVASGKEYLDEKKQNLSDAIEAGKDAMQREKEDLASSLNTDD